MSHAVSHGFDPGAPEGDRSVVACSIHGPFKMADFRKTGTCPECDRAAATKEPPPKQQHAETVMAGEVLCGIQREERALERALGLLRRLRSIYGDILIPERRDPELRALWAAVDKELAAAPGVPLWYGAPPPAPAMKSERVIAYGDDGKQFYCTRPLGDAGQYVPGGHACGCGEFSWNGERVSCNRCGAGYRGLCIARAKDR